MAFLARWLLILTIILPPMHAYAADALELAEQEIKAGLLYNFLKYTQWPPELIERSQVLTVCLFGKDPFSNYLAPMSGRTVNQRVITLRSVRNVNEAGSCQMLFFNAEEKARWAELRQALNGKSVLTVSDLNGFTDAGGMIEFGRKENHVQVALNMGAVTAAGLIVQERLLKLVTVVHPEGTH